MYIWLLRGNNRLIKQFPSYSERTLIYMLLILFFCLVLRGRWAAISLFTAVAARLLLFTCSLRQQIWSTVWWIRKTKANKESAAEVLIVDFTALTSLRFLSLWFHFRLKARTIKVQHMLLFRLSSDSRSDQTPKQQEEHVLLLLASAKSLHKDLPLNLAAVLFKVGSLWSVYVCLVI